MNKERLTLLAARPMNAATKGNRKDLADAFRAALEYLSRSCDDQNGKQTHICQALDIAFFKGKIRSEQRKSAKRIVSNRLNGSSTLKSWLFNHHPELSSKIECDKKCWNLQTTRKAWLESLIEEFS